MQGAALRIGSVAAGGDGALMLARLTSTAWLVAGVWLTMRLALLLAPRRRSTGALRSPGRAWIAGTAGLVVAATPSLSHLGGLVFNDVPAFTLSTACLLVGVTTAMSGITTRRLLLLGGVLGAAALTRVSCLPAVAIAALLTGYGAWHHGIGIPRGRRALVAIGASLPLVPAVAFWLRNIALYGDLTASATLLAKFDRDLNDPVSQLLVDRMFWLRLWNRMAADLTTGHWAVGLRANLTELLLLAALTGLGVILWRLRDPGRPITWLRNPRAVSWALCLLLPAALLASTVQFHAAGGSLHGRYLLGGHAVTATVLVIALVQLPRVGRPLALAAPAVLLVVSGFLLQGMRLHHAAIWARSGIEMELPMLTGSATDGLVLVCTMLAWGLLGLATVQRLRDRSGVVVDRDDSDPSNRSDPSHQGTRRIRSIRESAAA
ncbi:hypothetical protein BH23ACT9_BH23ACT9_04410 [soil metagenome]